MHEHIKDQRTSGAVASSSMCVRVGNEIERLQRQIDCLITVKTENSSFVRDMVTSFCFETMQEYIMLNALQVRIPEREERKAGEKHVLSKHHGKRHSTW